ncbi:hypothetical protein [Novosphingobium sp. NDB2Meth1]|uniref:hypothetical protein n=1 Tax=Novosphingobium sp. NDB2Meth1 TaxID=1892847 RepID=UPI0011608F54|nr:hypothetical protein [Novosphingobium sp. NDB2Meth1]
MGILSYGFVFINFADPPCTRPSEFRLFVVPASFVASSIIFFSLIFRGGRRTGIIALLLPVLAACAYEATEPLETARQKKCAAQTLPEAIASCRANPSHYRLGKSPSGFATVTLHAPGTTDRSWSCLEDWAARNGKYSMVIDESVYAAARAAYQRSQSAKKR